MILALHDLGTAYGSSCLSEYTHLHGVRFVKCPICCLALQCTA